MSLFPLTRQQLAEIRELELTGQYHRAFDLLSVYWPNKNEPPSLESFEELEAAEILLRCGEVAGSLGRLESNSIYQEISRDLLVNSREILQNHDDIPLLVECEVALAKTYLRRHEIEEAEVWLQQAFERDLSTTHFARIESFIVMSTLLVQNGKDEDAISFLKSVEKFVFDFDNDYLNGCFSTNLALAYKRVGKKPETMQMLNLARYFHTKSGHRAYLATTYNNLAYVFLEERRFSSAHEAVDKSLEIHKETGDISRFAYTLDTKAEIFEAEGKLDRAIATASEAIDILRSTEMYEFLINAYATLSRLRIKQREFALGAIEFSEALRIAEKYCGRSKREQLAKSFESDIAKQTSLTTRMTFLESNKEEEELELSLSPLLSSFCEFDAVKLNSDSISSIGLKAGFIALVVDTQVYEGDPIVIQVEGEDSVECGFLQFAPGEVWLRRDSGSITKHDETCVTIVGKVVGGADPGKAKDGKLEAFAVEWRNGSR
ncbi:MAG: tetratricopeptide repeat protein [Pyrinomonadaceae bacterium]